MQSIKKIRGLRGFRFAGARCAQAISLFMILAGGANAESCLAPQRPFVPRDPQAARDYADIIRNDFELYIRDIQGYFRCLEEERTRAIEEAREVTEEYGRFLELVK